MPSAMTVPELKLNPTVSSEKVPLPIPYSANSNSIPHKSEEETVAKRVNTDTVDHELDPECSDCEQTKAQYKQDRVADHRQHGSMFESAQIQIVMMQQQSHSQRKKSRTRKKPDLVHEYLPIMLKLSILSAWCAFTTVALGFGLWTVYPTMSSVVDSTINAICVYLSFGFSKRAYVILCSPFIACTNCSSCQFSTQESEINKRVSVLG